MNIKNINNKCQEIKTFIEQYRLTEAMSALQELAYNQNNFRVIDRLKQLRQTYDYMSRYLLSGMPDDTRRQVYNDIVINLKNIIDIIIREEKAEDSSDVYSSVIRVLRLRNINFNDLLNELKSIDLKISLAESVDGDIFDFLMRKDSILKDLFEYIWVSLNDKAMIEAIRNYISDKDANIDYISYIISSLTLSLLGYYDKDKVELLFDIYNETESEIIAARSLTALMLVLKKHSKRIEDDKSVVDRFALWEDSIITFRRLRETLNAIIRTRDTDRITSKMKEEVIPELMKMKPDILNKIKDSGMDFENNLMEQNAEWEEMLNKTGIGKKMRELSEMQNEGADLMMVTFSNLKQFPFFYNVGAWFLPFDFSNPTIKLDDRLKKVLGELLSTGFAICDSDKYSLVFALSNMPEEQRNMVISQFEAQISQMSEEVKDSLLKRSMPEFDLEVTRFIRDLYRFFKLYRKHNEFFDPFSSPFNFLDIPVIGNILSDNEILKITSEFYFKRGYYSEALDLFERLDNGEKSDAVYWEKTGYCHQCLKEYEKALLDYHKAELLRTPGSWLIKKLAVINKRLGRYEDAAEYYDLALSSDPDNVSLILASADMKYEMRKYKEALSGYYHASYLVSDDIRILRSIAWTELLDRQFEKSESTYKKILSMNPSASDYMNAAHLYIVIKNIPRAVDLYKMSAINNPVEFEKDFLADIPVVVSLGADELDMHLLLDALKAELNI